MRGLLTYRADTVDPRDPVITTNGGERATSADEEPRTEAELQRELERLTDPELDEMQRATRREMLELVTDGVADTEPDAKALDIEHQASPIQVRKRSSAERATPAMKLRAGSQPGVRRRA